MRRRTSELIRMPAPELKGMQEWINSRPLKIAKLRGKVIFLDFWAYSCINCIRTLPHVQGLWERYKKDGLVVIGAHVPEFEFEKDVKNLRAAAKKHGLTYPIVQDNNGTSWGLYGNKYWPRVAIIDARGEIRYDHVGEGAYEQKEETVRQLLQEAGKKLSSQRAEKENQPIRLFPKIPSPETYLGSARSSGFGSSGVCTPTGCKYIDQSEQHDVDIVYLQGEWKQETEFVEFDDKEGFILLKYKAIEANMVLKSVKGKLQCEVLLNGKSLTKANAGPDFIFKNGKSFVVVENDDLYRIVRTKGFGEHELKLIPKRGLQAFTYTFG